MTIANQIYTQKQLDSTVKCVEVEVKGSYIARVNDRMREVKPYKIKVLLPEKFTKSDLKRQAARTLLADDKDHPQFLTMRTFEQAGKPTASKSTKKLRDFFSYQELERMERLRLEAEKAAKEEKKARGNIAKGIAGDTSEYDEKTGLPPLVDEMIA